MPEVVSAWLRDSTLLKYARTKSSKTICDKANENEGLVWKMYLLLHSVKDALVITQLSLSSILHLEVKSKFVPNTLVNPLAIIVMLICKYYIIEIRKIIIQFSLERFHKGHPKVSTQLQDLGANGRPKLANLYSFVLRAWESRD